MHKNRERRTGLIWGALIAAAGTLVVLLPGRAWGQAGAQPLPEFATVRALVLRALVALPERQPGDIIARSEVEPIFDQLRLMGWAVHERKHILHQTPGDTDFVLQQLRTDPGRRFMRRIAKYPSAYDRLCRLAALPGGRRLVVDLIQEPGGDRFIEYLTKSKGGKNLTQMLKDIPNAANFDQPTGKLFTAEQLIDQLQASYAAEQKRRDSSD
ncbi:MAG: hypothetical protein A2W31_07255 [Planctomycetes bacterium RBG_16_64_10]|nr:MAG: hypothetical protein A2W31_07255 [Planctomycetes bacterium RBG_16_64_10]